MNLLEMRKEKENKKAEVRALLAENKITEAEAKMQEVRDLETKIKIQEEIENAEERELNENGAKRNLDNGKEERTDEEIEEEEIRSFENAKKQNKKYSTGNIKERGSETKGKRTFCTRKISREKLWPIYISRRYLRCSKNRSGGSKRAQLVVCHVPRSMRNKR